MLAATAPVQWVAADSPSAVGASAHRSVVDSVPVAGASVQSAAESASAGVASVPQSAAEVAPGVMGGTRRSAVESGTEGMGSVPPLSAVPYSGAEIGFVLADGLSPRALADHGVQTLAALIAELAPHYSLAPPVIATQARVALGDHIAAAMGVRTVIVLIGERPGLSVADSLGIYLTHRPRPGRTDADRNCISNIHPPDGLTYTRAAKVAAALVTGAHRLGRSGVDLKDTSRSGTLDSAGMLGLGSP
ncbi:ethanolamine ammonia-lyase light chain EutC [Nocardia brasiliensis]|uniref:ethanolamine ammonia-lyase light chain EutC n=1 Tax=Nocardia brasiliensis TaxID=37326 RepID=UPI003A5D17FE